MTYIASSILGAFAAAAFFGLLVPQVYWNYVRRSTEGMSPSMIALWIIAGVLFVAYLHSVAQPNVALLVQWHSVNFLCCVIAGQWYRYRNRRPPPRLFSGQASNTPAPLRLSTPRLSASVTPTKEEKVILKLPAADRARASTRAQALFRHSVSQQQSPAAAASPAPTAVATTPDGAPVTPRLAAGGDGRGGAGTAPTPMVVTIDHSLNDPALARNSAYTMGGTLRPLPPFWHGALFGASWCAAYVIVFLGAWQIFEQCKGVDGADWIPWVGGSILPAVMLAAGFVPQATLIIRVKSSEGFSRLLALVDLFGATLSIIAIGVDNTHSVEYKQMIPYFVICGCQLFMFVLTTCIYPPLVIIDDTKGGNTAIALTERVPVATSADNKTATPATGGGPAVNFFDAPAGGGPRKSVTDASSSSSSSAAATTAAVQPAPSSEPNPTIDTSSQPIPAGAPQPLASPSTTTPPSVSMEPVVPPEAASALLLSVSLPSSDGSSDGLRVDSAAVTTVEPESVSLTVV